MITISGYLGATQNYVSPRMVLRSLKCALEYQSASSKQTALGQTARHCGWMLAHGEH